MSDYHIPVLLHDVIQGLRIKPNGVYVDVTFGGGGHSKEILKQLGPDGRLFAFDQDVDAEENLLDDPRFVFTRQNFQFFRNTLLFHGVEKVDGLLADLGVSSHQFDVAERGFSYRFDGPLDMRMNRGLEMTAAQVLNEYEENKLTDVFYHYGEFRNARRIAAKVVAARELKPFKTTKGLAEWFSAQFDDKTVKGLARLYQALRIEVNRELEVLKKFLQESAEVLAPGGRLVVMSYHSLEDRLVKNYIKKGDFEGKEEKDLYGNVVKPLKDISRKAIMPDDEEIKRNSRARSAKLRIGEKL